MKRKVKCESSTEKNPFWTRNPHLLPLKWCPGGVVSHRTVCEGLLFPAAKGHAAKRGQRPFAAFPLCSVLTVTESAFREKRKYGLFFFFASLETVPWGSFFFLGTSPTAVYTALIKMWCLQPSFWARTDVALQWKTLPRRSEISVTYGN